jgi:DNA-directed RNA polymerase subunit RPC12/RpoP
MQTILFRCAGCDARIKAPLQMQGQMRACPGCGHRFVVRPRRVEDAGPALVPPPPSGSLVLPDRR